MIAIKVPRQIDHFDRFTKAQARMRAAETTATLDRAINAMDIASASVISAPVLTAADAALASRAQEWVNTRPRQVITAHRAMADRALYRVRRVAVDRPYAQLESQL